MRKNTSPANVAAARRFEAEGLCSYSKALKLLADYGNVAAARAAALEEKTEREAAAARAAAWAAERAARQTETA